MLTETFAEHCSSSRIPNISLSCVLKEISSEALLLQLLLVALPKVEVSVQILGGDKGTREELVCYISDIYAYIYIYIYILLWK